MTHDELLAKIINMVWDKSEVKSARAESLRNALRAVVELHKPWTLENEHGILGTRCSFCVSYEYPCATIQAIEKELEL